MGGGSDAGTIILIVSLLAALVMSIIFLPKSKRDSMGKGGQFMHDLVNFRHFFIADILKFAYIFLSVYMILSGLYVVVEGYTEGLLTVILGPVVIRLGYEFIMMFISLVENVCEINKKMPSKGATTQPAPQAPATPVAPVAPVAPAAPKTVFCTNCGAQCEADSKFCVNCGKTIE